MPSLFANEGGGGKEGRSRFPSSAADVVCRNPFPCTFGGPYEGVHITGSRRNTFGDCELSLLREKRDERRFAILVTNSDAEKICSLFSNDRVTGNNVHNDKRQRPRLDWKIVSLWLATDSDAIRQKRRSRDVWDQMLI